MMIIITCDLVGVQGEVGVQDFSHVHVTVVFQFIHVVRWVSDLHVQASVSHRLPLNTLPPEHTA